MKIQARDLSRRNFIRKGAAVAAATSILAIERVPAMGGTSCTPTPPMTDDPVTTEAVQTLNNKTIKRATNILGTDYLNIREFVIPPGSNPDITCPLDAAIAALSGPGGYGGQILIPHGFWTSKGGHEIGNSISIEGTGMNLMAPGVSYGSNIILAENDRRADYVFSLTANSTTAENKTNCAIRNLGFWLDYHPTDGIGLLITGTEGYGVYMTLLGNVQFYGGRYGVKVDSTAGHLDCTSTRFEHVSFNTCRTSFYCNSINGGYTFDNCRFSLPTTDEKIHMSAGTAFDIYYMGNMSVEHCLFGGSQQIAPFDPVTDGSTILKTHSKFNSIVFKDCQDEVIQYYFQNDTDHWPYNPVVLKNCLTQSAFKATKNASVVLESCMVNNPSPSLSGVYSFEDTSTGYLKLYLKGLTNSVTQNIGFGYPLSTNFVNSGSEIIREATYGKPLVATSASSNYTTDAFRGIVLIGSGQSSITISNSKVTADSVVFAQLRTNDTGGARIREVTCASGVATINLTAPAAATLSVAFKIDEPFLTGA